MCRGLHEEDILLAELLADRRPVRCDPSQEEKTKARYLFMCLSYSLRR